MHTERNLGTSTCNETSLDKHATIECYLLKETISILVTINVQNHNTIGVIEGLDE